VEVQENEGFEIPTWEQVYAMLLDLAQVIRKDRFACDIIVGVSRGGWTPARILSDLLENPAIANVKAEFYLGIAETQKTPVITQSVSVDVQDKLVLVVDDVSDTGKSLQMVKSHLQKHGVKALKIATLYYKPWSIVKPDYYEKTTRRWIIFPWERKEALKKVVKQFQQNGRMVEDAKQTLVDCGFDEKLATRFIREFAEGSGC
jgi:hypothetical protein